MWRFKVPRFQVKRLEADICQKNIMTAKHASTVLEEP